jgi:3-oxoacyl-[acyl-carrier protein] reductase
MKVILRKIKLVLRRALKLSYNVPRLFRLAPHILRTGGHMSVNVATVNYGDSLLGKTVLVTGGGSGIGLSIARKALDMGATVLITGRDAQKLEHASRELNNKNLQTLVWDVSDIEAIASHFNHALTLLGGDLDILINNAGVLSKEIFPNVGVNDWERVYDINSKAVFFLTQETTKHWLKIEGQNIKKIINISSQGGYVGATYPYRMTKWDIAGLTQGLGLKLASHGILVNGIAPGIIATNMQQNYIAQGENRFCELNPLGRIALPEEIAEFAAFLMCDAGNFFVGQTFVCDGGFSLK